MRLEMPFSEALERFVGVDPEEMHANIKRAKTKKPLGGKKPRSGSSSSSQNVVSLRDRRQKRRNGR